MLTSLSRGPVNFSLMVIVGKSEETALVPEIINILMVREDLQLMDLNLEN